VKASELIAQADRLARATKRKPRQVDLKRAVSATYYAMFHALAKECADTIAGTGPQRSDPAWVQVYRALEHGVAKNACKQARNKGIPPEIVKFAETFVALQEERHAADYDPQSFYARAAVSTLVADAAQAIDDLGQVARAHRRAFVALVLLREPRR
jgi:hypothetical protein